MTYEPNLIRQSSDDLARLLDTGKPIRLCHGRGDRGRVTRWRGPRTAEALLKALASHHRRGRWAVARIDDPEPWIITRLPARSTT